MPKEKRIKHAAGMKIPFDTEGDQMHHSYQSPPETDVWTKGWEDNTPFEDTLTYLYYCRGRSAAYFMFRRSNGKTVSVFMTDMNEMIPLMQLGKITGTFIFSKRGKNYGCTLLEVENAVPDGL